MASHLPSVSLTPHCCRSDASTWSGLWQPPCSAAPLTSGMPVYSASRVLLHLICLWAPFLYWLLIACGITSKLLSEGLQILIHVVPVRFFWALHLLEEQHCCAPGARGEMAPRAASAELTVAGAGLRVSSPAPAPLCPQVTTTSCFCSLLPQGSSSPTYLSSLGDSALRCLFLGWIT